MFKSKSSPAAEPAPAVPTGDAAAAQRLTGTPTAGGPVTGGGPTATQPTSTSTPATGGGPSTGETRPNPVIPPPGSPTQANPKTAPPATGPSAVKRTTSNAKRIMLLVVGALIALFAVFNSQNVQVHWIFGDAVNTPLIVVIAIAFLAGGIIGWLVAKLGGRNRIS